MERPAFTREDVLRASTGEIPHPIGGIINRFLPQLSGLAERYRAITTPQRREVFNSVNYGFLADAVEDLGDFGLDPVDMVSIWAAVVRVPTGFDRYGFAAIVATSYAIREVHNAYWYRFPRYFIEHSKLPSQLAGDTQGLTVVRANLRKIRENLLLLDEVVYGNAKSSADLATELGARMAKGDEEVFEQYGRECALYKERSIPLVGRLQESFDNALLPLSFAIEDAIEGRVV